VGYDVKAKTSFGQSSGGDAFGSGRIGGRYELKLTNQNGNIDIVK
jgi:hypothetical protein